MKKITIDKTEDGIKLHKYLKNIFREMPNSLLQKLLRKKYFEINGKIANGNETLVANDILSIYIGDETFNKFFIKTKNIEKKENYNDELFNLDKYYDKIISHIVYEDDNLIVFNKWAGILSQGDKTSDISVNKLLNQYLNKKDLNNDNDSNNNKNIALYNYNKAVVNRLDRNTDGLIIFAKSYIFAREISKLISENLLDKYYKTIVNGVVAKDEDTLVNYYKKDEKNNIAIIKDINVESVDKNIDGFTIVKLKYSVLKRNTDSTILDVKLITGKSHQIRSQLSHIGHPIVCDKKYMDVSLYNDNVKKYKHKSQILVCYKIIFPIFEHESIKYLSNKTFEICTEF